jgi:hypothetical protein
VKDQIIDLEVTVYQARPVLGLCGGLQEILEDFLEALNLPDSLLCITVDNCRLSLMDTAKGLDLTVKVVPPRPVILKPNLFSVNTVELGKCQNCLVPSVALSWSAKAHKTRCPGQDLTFRTYSVAIHLGWLGPRRSDHRGTP